MEHHDEIVGKIADLTAVALGKLVDLTPRARHRLEREVGAVGEAVRMYNDEEIRGWVAEGRTQAWIGEQVGVTPQAISKRMTRLGITPAHPKKQRDMRPFAQPVEQTPSSHDEGGDTLSASEPPTAPSSPNGNQPKGWLMQLRSFSRSLPWILRRRQPPPERLMDALRVIDEMKDAIETALDRSGVFTPDADGPEGMSQEEWDAKGATQVQEALEL